MSETLSENKGLLSKIEHVLEEKIRPELSLHGGNIRVEKLEQGILYVRMLGQCSGCPSAELTMENLVNTELKAAFPELGQIVLVTGVCDELMEEARRMLQKRHLQAGNVKEGEGL